MDDLAAEQNKQCTSIAIGQLELQSVLEGLCMNVSGAHNLCFDLQDLLRVSALLTRPSTLLPSLEGNCACLSILNVSEGNPKKLKGFLHPLRTQLSAYLPT